VVKIEKKNSSQKNREIYEQAEQLNQLLPALAHHLFAQPKVSDDGTLSGGLSPTQLRLCLLLEAGAQNMSTLSEEMGITMSAVTQLADRLERAKVVERSTGQEDRRVKLLQLTPYGKEILQARLHSRLRRMTDALSLLPPDLRVTLLQNLTNLLEACYVVAPEVQNTIAEVFRIVM
jgi:DNA-binding MarR family transcriptional regulator